MSPTDAETKTGIERKFKGIWRFWVPIPALLCYTVDRLEAANHCVINWWLVLWPSEVGIGSAHQRCSTTREEEGKATTTAEKTHYSSVTKSRYSVCFSTPVKSECSDSLPSSASPDTETKEWLELLLRIMKVSEWLCLLKAIQRGLRLNQWNSYALIRNGWRNVGFGSRTVKWFILTLHEADRSSSVWDWNSKHPSAFYNLSRLWKNNPFCLWKQCPCTKLVWVSIAELMTWADTQRNMHGTPEQ